jgi:hypothetical protein
MSDNQNEEIKNTVANLEDNKETSTETTETKTEGQGLRKQLEMRIANEKKLIEELAKFKEAEKLKEEEEVRKKEERQYIQSVMENKKCDWRKELNEMMTTADVFFTTLPATGDLTISSNDFSDSNTNLFNSYVSGSDVVFVTAGMGGGTGTGSAPIVAGCAKRAGALTVGVVTTPFAFEGKKRMNNALEGINNFSKEVDTLIVIPNENLISMLDQDISMKDAFKEADNILLKAVAGISDLITTPGQINIDFADI